MPESVVTLEHPATIGNRTIDVCHIRRGDNPRFCCGLPVEEPLHTVHPRDITTTPCVKCGRPRCPLCAEAYSPSG